MRSSREMSGLSNRVTGTQHHADCLCETCGHRCEQEALREADIIKSDGVITLLPRTTVRRLSRGR